MGALNWESLNCEALKQETHDLGEYPTAGHQKAFTRPQQGVRGRRPPGWQRSLNFKNDSKYQKMNLFLKNIKINLARKIHFFYENIRKAEQILQKFLNFSKSYCTNFKFYEAPSKSRKFPLNSIIQLRILSENSKMAQNEKEYWESDENS